jgi:hypothetical protein
MQSPLHAIATAVITRNERATKKPQSARVAAEIAWDGCDGACPTKRRELRT